MEPLRPEEKARILAENPDVSPAELDEYERLLAERFARDPGLPATAEVRRREDRLAELYLKLFPEEHDVVGRVLPRTW
ncbi:MAG TPA: hypothetical protein VFQ39_00065 [Longimicrobium sp.]|nr:hypothetical protein [Longimicrobium sp.]